MKVSPVWNALLWANIILYFCGLPISAVLVIFEAYEGEYLAVARHVCDIVIAMLVVYISNEVRKNGYFLLTVLDDEKS